MKKLVYLLLPAIALVGCQNDDECSFVQPEPTKAISVNRTIDEAMQIALDASKAFGGETRANMALSASDVQCVVRQKSTTRSGAENDTLLYVVNYGNESGFAVVSAKNGGEALLAYTEKGDYSPEALEAMDCGFVDFMQLAEDYVEINNAGAPMQSPMPMEHFVTEYIDEVYEQYGPYITVQWGQNGCEGMYAPNGVAGCYSTAVAMIMSYFEWPTSIDLTFSNAPASSVQLDWTLMKRHVGGMLDCSMAGHDDAHTMIGLIARQIGEEAHSNYYSNSNQTSSLGTIYSRDIFQSHGYSATAFTSYVSGKNFATELASNNLILVRGSMTEGGHAWVIDGYKRFKRTTNQWIVNDLTGERRLNVSSEAEHEYNHINWGWDGQSNGYFNIGVFSASRAQSYDNTSPGYDNTYVANFTNIRYMTVTR